MAIFKSILMFETSYVICLNNQSFHLLIYRSPSFDQQWQCVNDNNSNVQIETMAIFKSILMFETSYVICLNNQSFHLLIYRSPSFDQQEVMSLGQRVFNMVAKSGEKHFCVFFFE